MKTDLDLHSVRGLSNEEATRRLAAEGYNQLPSGRPRSLMAIAVDVVREPMILLLVAAGTLYILLGDLAEAVLLIASIVLIVGINLYQERRTERALEALRDLSSPRALVIRDGSQVRIAGRDVVRGDVIVLAEGDRIPADATLLASINLSADESMLTGESVPVRKVSGKAPVATPQPGGDDQPFVYSGTLVVSGHGVAEVHAIGAHTAMGRIGKALEAIQIEQTRIQVETRKVVRVLASVAIALCLLVAVAYGLTRDHWIDGLLTSVTLAIAIIPEEFPVVLTVFLALGAWRLSRQQVLTRRVPAIETLGAATILCVDKTGTLTLNQMTVQRLFAQGSVHEVNKRTSLLPNAFKEVAEFGALASQREPYDPMERALKELADQALASAPRLQDDWILVREYPLSPGLLALSRVWRTGPGPECVIAAKGAPEAIADLCRLDGDQARELARQVEMMAADGLRVLGVAKAQTEEPTLPDDQHDFAFQFVGLVGLVDPVRPSVPGAIKECYSAGIRVVMMTGDYAGTARHIALETGLDATGDVLTGPEIAQMSDQELRLRAASVCIFARVVPEQKLRLVNAFKANGEIVAMTGDGVNDAPALKAADIGIAMGGRGTDVAREAAALVLLDDDFSSIVRAVRLGRGIYANLRKAMAYLLAVHVPIAGISVLPVLFHTPLVLMPAHVVFLELIIDPACSVAFEAEPIRADVMTSPPRQVDTPLFSRLTVGLSLLQGAGVFLIVLAVYVVTLERGLGEEESRAMTFTTLVVANLALILTNRSWSRTILATLRVPNPAFWLVLAGASTVLGLVLYVPFLQGLFHFGLLKPNELALCLFAGVVSILWFEVLKLVRGNPLA